MLKKSKLILLLLLTGLVLAGCTFDSISAQQEKTTLLLPELLKGKSYGQIFTSSRNNLYRIDLGTATFGHINSAEVIFHLQESPGSAVDLFSKVIPADQVQNERPTTITFPSIPDSSNKSYYFWIESPQASPGNAISLYINEEDNYSGGTAYQDGKAVPGDIVFSAYSQDQYSFEEVLHSFFGRVSADPAFMILYAVVILSLIAILIAIRVQRNP